MSKTHMRFSLLMMAASLSLSACAFSKGPTPEQQKITSLQQQLDSNTPILEDDFKTEFIPGENQDEYTARTSWPEGRQVSVRVSDGENVRTYDGRVQNSFTIPCVGKKVDFRIETFSSPEKILSKIRVQKDCPKDLLVKGTSATAADLSAATGRIVIEDKSVISLGANPLKIQAESITIKGTAKVQTYSWDTSYRADSQDKFVAHEISIQAKRASGKLEFELNGINGAPVADRPDVYDSALAGRAGDAGELRLYTVEAQMDGGRVVSYRSECLRQPSNGARGRDAVVQQADGKFAPIVGSKGLNGNPGLGTSVVNINVADVSGLSLFVTFNPGLASAPGKGALPKGGVGGAPGVNPKRPAQYEIGPVCADASRGASGEDGLRGPIGDVAADGRCGQISIPAELMSRIQMKDLQLSCSKEPGILRPI